MTATTTNSSRTKLVNISPEYSQEATLGNFCNGFEFGVVTNGQDVLLDDEA